MLYLHHADRLEPLLVSMASVLAPAPADPFTPDVVVVPTTGMGDLTMAGLGRLLGATGPDGDGIVANVEFVFPGQFTSRALGHAPGERTEHDPWHVSALTWAVLDMLAADAVEIPGPNRSRTERWALARRLADLFDRYATQRPDVITAWAAGRDEDGTGVELPSQHRWQPDLWRAVRRHIAVPSPPEQFPTLVADLRVGRVTPQLPERVGLFGFGAIPPAQLRVLQALGAVREVHVFLRHPSRAAWDAVEQGLGGRLVARTAEDVVSLVHHPLLGSWGRPALETRSLVVGVTGVEWCAAPVEPCSDSTLLGALQSGVHLDEAPTRRAAVRADDGTVQVHACHGETRQVEVLRDALGHAFVDDPTLTPRDVLVLCPDLDRFAPLVEAVFARGALPIAVRIGDRSLSTAEPVVDALHAVLALVSGRATLSEMLALVQFEPVRRRFGWSLDDVEQLAEWCTDIGARWGLEAEHRREWEVPERVQTGTWRSFVDRLLAGSAMPAPSPRLVLGDVAPYDLVGADELELVGSVADLVARLVDLHARVRNERPVDAWIDLVRQVIDDFCEVDPDESWRRQGVLGQLEQIRAASAGTNGPNQVRIGLSDVRAMLADGLTDRPGRLPLRSGAVTVSSLVPQSGVPARVVCLLGLDHGSLRGGSFDGDDVLGLRPCIGERHPRHESRQLLLDAVLSARDVLIITCNGSDITTNAPVPLTVPLVELLDVIRSLVELDEHLGPVVVHHPRHGFDERALRPGALPPAHHRPFTFDPAMLEAATVKRSATADAAADETAGETAGDGRWPWVLPPVAIERLDLDDLIVSVRRPAEVYLRHRLDVRLPGEASEVDEGLPVTVDALRRANLGSSLLTAMAADTDVDGWTRAVRLHGWLPPDELGSATIASVRTDAERIVEAARAAGVPIVGRDSLDIDQVVEVPIDGQVVDVLVSGTVGSLVLGESTGCLVDVRFGKTKPWQRLAAAIRLAALARAHPDREWSAVVVAHNGKSPPATWRLVPRIGDGVGDGVGDGDGAVDPLERLLAVGVTVRWWAYHDAVPLFDATSFALASGSTSKARDGFDRDLEYDAHATLLWSGASFDDLLTLPVPERLSWLFPVGESPVDPAATMVASWVWGAYHGAVEQESLRVDSKAAKAAKAGAADAGDVEAGDSVSIGGS